ncbi:MAG: hypothetical protein JXB04_03240 [Kiritimatiellae bacterium]|nr:hypothetical protein [Kiritimatiellia bacterium]
MNICLKTGLLILAAVVLAGCSTPDYRIKQNPDLYNSFPPEVQERVRGGNIGIGYTRDMVFIALGKPNREYVRTTADGTTEVWSYTDTTTTRERQRVEGDFRVRDAGGRFRTVRDTVWVEVNRDHEYESLRVEFENDTIRAIERVKR